MAADNTPVTTPKDDGAQAKISQDHAPFRLDYQLILRNSHENENPDSSTGGSELTETADTGNRETLEDSAEDKKEESYTMLEPLDAVRLIRADDGVPARLELQCTTIDVDIKEGNVIQFNVNGTTVFQGFVFGIERRPDNTMKVTAYDQLRYLKNKDVIVYQNKTATELIQQICDDYGLKVGELDNTQYKIPLRVEDNKTLVDIINYALTQTLIYTEKHDLYHLYDDAGKIMLKHIDKMELDVYVDAESMQDYIYRTSIDKDTYDVVKVVREAPGEQGKKLVRTGLVVDEDHIKEWGRLQYLLRPDNKTVNAMDRAKRIMTLKNRKTREIRLKGVLGDTRVRGGSMIFLVMDFGDVQLKNYMMVTNVTHTFAEGLHTMDMDLYYVDKPAKYEVKEDNDQAIMTQIKEEEQKKRQQRKQRRRGGYTYNGNGYGGMDAGQVEAGFNAAEGRVSPYGSEGCVDTTLYTLSYANPDCADLYSAGVADTSSLCSGLEARGYTVTTYNGYAEKGDILLYGDRDHAVVADGAGGCFGNSSSLGYAKRYGDVNYAWNNGSAPTEIIHMNKGG